MTPGQIAYEAYGQYRDWLTFGGTPMPAWEDSTPEIRDAWEAAGRAAALFVNGKSTPHVEPSVENWDWVPTVVSPGHLMVIVGDAPRMGTWIDENNLVLNWHTTVLLSDANELHRLHTYADHLNIVWLPSWQELPDANTIASYITVLRMRCLSRGYRVTEQIVC